MKSGMANQGEKPLGRALSQEHVQQLQRVLRTQPESAHSGWNGGTTTIAPLLVRPEEAAGLLSISRSRVYELMATGGLPSVVLGRSRRIPLAALQRWVEEQVD